MNPHKLLLPVTIILSVIFASCSGRPEPKLRIGVSQCSSDDWRNKMNQELLREVIAHPEIEVEIRSADDNNDRMAIGASEAARLIRLALDILQGRPFEKENTLPMSSAVDASNADILLLQNEALTEETAKNVSAKPTAKPRQSSATHFRVPADLRVRAKRKPGTFTGT